MKKAKKQRPLASKYETERKRIKRKLWNNLPAGLFSAGEIETMARALAESRLSGTVSEPYSMDELGLGVHLLGEDWYGGRRTRSY